MRMPIVNAECDPLMRLLAVIQMCYQVFGDQSQSQSQSQTQTQSQTQSQSQSQSQSQKPKNSKPAMAKTQLTSIAYIMAIVEIIGQAYRKSMNGVKISIRMKMNEWLFVCIFHTPMLTNTY